MTETSPTAWRAIRERGSRAGILLTAIAHRRLGAWLAEPILWGVAAYFFLTDSGMRRASRKYLEKVGKPGWRNVYRHYLSFALTSLERVDAWSDRLKSFSIHYFGIEHLDRLAAAHRGAVLIGAHMGNIDGLRALGTRRQARVNILMDRRNSRQFSQILKRYAPQMEEGLLEYEPGSIDQLLQLKNAVESGEFVGLLGDRVAAESARGAARVSEALFLGERAPFPHAPFLFAAHLQCPVLLVFSLRRARRAYDFYVEPFAERIELPEDSRNAALDAYAQAYAARLEHYCRKYPLQWFNFYDFWRKESYGRDQ